MSTLQSALASAQRAPGALAPVPAAVRQVVVRLRSEYQQPIIDRIRERLGAMVKRLLVVAPTAAGKCLARGTPVLMFDGSVKDVEDVVVGDLLMGPDSKPRRVTSLARGREYMSFIAQYWRDAEGCWKTSSYVVNDSHILSLRKDGKVVNLSVRDYNLFREKYRLSGWRVPGVLSGDLTVVEHDVHVFPLGEDDYFGFELDGPDRLFLLGDFTVTHNTVMFSYIAHGAAQKGKRILILAHRDILIRQASNKLNDNGVDHGIIMAGFTYQPMKRVQVASVQTLVRRVDKLKAAGLQFDIIIADEAHLSVSNSWKTCIDAWPDAALLGWTGSPIRLDGKGLGRDWGGHFDEIIAVDEARISRLINLGYLVKPSYFGSKEKIDLTGVRKIGRDYDADALAQVMDKPQITGDCINEYKKTCPGVPAVAWCVNVKHAEHVADEFNRAGIPAVALSGKGEAEGTVERNAALADLAAGRIKVITFAQMLTEGVDCPEIGCVILLRPTMSLASYLQTIGRGLRPIYAPGMPLGTVEERFAAIDAGPKSRRCFVLDHCDLWARHGFAHQDREWSLDGVIKRKSKKKKVEDDEPKLIQCKRCFHIFDPAPTCPSCGAPVEIKASGPQAREGDLSEITEDMARAMQDQRRREVHGARSLDDLLKIAAERGYSPTWARMIFEARKRKSPLAKR